MSAASPGLASLLRALPVSDAARPDLHRRLAEPLRHYHGTAHVALLRRRHGASSFLVR